MDVKEAIQRILMTVEEYLAEAERFRLLKEQSRDRYTQDLFARMERSYRTLAECDALLRGESKHT